MSDPYRNFLSPYEPKQIPDKNVYRYFVHKDTVCPLCKKDSYGYLPLTFFRSWVTQVPSRRGRALQCHPLKRLTVASAWFWKKKCPIRGIHEHVECFECKVKWIVHVDADYEPSFHERIL